MNLCMKHVTCTAVMPCANAPTSLLSEKFKQLLRLSWHYQTMQGKLWLCILTCSVLLLQFTSLLNWHRWCWTFSCKRSKKDATSLVFSGFVCKVPPQDRVRTLTFSKYLYLLVQSLLSCLGHIPRAAAPGSLQA